METNHITKYSCGVCTKNNLTPISGNDKLPGVTSDDKPWFRSFTLYICNNCGHIQKITEENWQNDASKIYKNYEMYKQMGGAEHLVLGEDISSTRSEVILDNLEKEISLPNEGWMLDLGCGRGASLRTFNSRYSKWHLTGFDSGEGEQYREEILNIPGVEAFFSDSIDELPSEFDLISANYVMEHVTSPSNVLKKLRIILLNNGIISLIVPNFKENPFDLMVVDHCNHFTPEILSYLAKSLGYEPISIESNWVYRAIVSFFRKSTPVKKEMQSQTTSYIDDTWKIVSLQLKWLSDVKDEILEKSIVNNFGVFGTGAASGWIAGILGKKIKFFVDEDPRRIGKKHLDYPIFAPADVPEGSSIYIALPYQLAKAIKSRLAQQFPKAIFIIPPKYP